MEKVTLQFPSLAEMAMFSKFVTTGYIQNTIKFTITGKFTEAQIGHAINNFKAIQIETTEKVFTY